jgi:hypothetical protein
MDILESEKERLVCIKNAPTQAALDELARLDLAIIESGIIFIPGDQYLPTPMPDEEFRKKYTK